MAAFALVLLSACGGAGEEEPRAGGTYEDADFGFALDYPAGWRAARSVDSDRFTAWDVVVSNRQVRAEPFGGELDLPADGVALRILHSEGGPAPELGGEEARFPLEVDPAAAEPVHFFANGWDFYASAHAGPDASPADLAALRRVVRSLRFPALEEGASTGYGFFVLGRVEDYPVGTATRYDAADLPTVDGIWERPFYLVHAPGGFYALGWPGNLVRGYKHECDVGFDPDRFEFTCPELGARWSRVGEVLEKPAGRPDDALMLHATKVSWDGHVLVSTNEGSFGGGHVEGELWPEEP